MDINVRSTGSCGSGETWFDRQITKEQYDRAVNNRGYLIKDDTNAVLTDAERYGYGASAGIVYEHGGKYFVSCHRYNSCD